MKIRTLLSLLLLALAAACGGSGEEPPAVPGSGNPGAATPENRTLPEGEGKTVLLDVEGMSCAEMCAPEVRRQLMGVEGVASATVDFDAKRATVLVRKDVDLAALVAALEEPYRAKVAGLSGTTR